MGNQVRSMNKVIRWIEFVLLFTVGPVAIWWLMEQVPIIVSLWVATAGCLLWLKFDRSFDRRVLGGLSKLSGQWRSMVLLIVLSIPVMVVLTMWLLPGGLFALPSQRPVIWVMVCVFYPLLSVYPQEVIYRAFIWHRYSEIFPSPWARIAASGIMFGLMHFMFGNVVAVAVTLVGGVLFAWRYERCRSVAVVSLEHAIYGVLLFTIGVGAYLVAGTVRMAERMQ